jgi:hypothetical protein
MEGERKLSPHMGALTTLYINYIIFMILILFKLCNRITMNIIVVQILYGF